MATIRDVAAEAGLSTATVSRVINNNGRVDVALVARVNEAINLLGYRANPLGRALRRKRTPIWGFLASDIEAPFFASLLHGLEGQALLNGKLLMLCNTGEDLERERQYIQTALDYQFGGLVIAAASMTATELGRAPRTRCQSCWLTASRLPTPRSMQCWSTTTLGPTWR